MRRLLILAALASVAGCASSFDAEQGAMARQRYEQALEACKSEPARLLECRAWARSTYATTLKPSGPAEPTITVNVNH